MCGGKNTECSISPEKPLDSFAVRDRVVLVESFTRSLAAADLSEASGMLNLMRSR